MSDLESRIQHLSEDLQELIALTAQNADKSSINIVTKFEAFEEKIEEEMSRRWSAFKWSVGIAILLLTIVVPVNFSYLERLNAQVFTNSQRLSVIEVNDKDQLSARDFLTIIKELEKKDTETLAAIKDCVSQKDLSHVKTELYDWVLRLHRAEGLKGEVPKK